MENENKGTSGRIKRIRRIARSKGLKLATVDAIVAYWRHAWKADPIQAGHLMSDARAAVKQAIDSIEYERTQGNAGNWDRRTVAGAGIPSRIQEPRREGSLRKKAVLVMTSGRNGQHFNTYMRVRPARRGTR